MGGELRDGGMAGEGARGEEMCAPMMVRYCICQPYESLLSGVSMALS